MATIKIKVGVESSNVGADKLSFLLSKDITVTQPFQNITQVTADFAAPTVLLGVTNVQSYMFFRNIDSTNFIEIKDNAGNVLSTLRPLEYCLFPVDAAIGVEAQADTAACILEYAYWAVG